MKLINIDLTKKYTFGQVLDELSKDSTLSFIANGKLYFKRKGIVRCCESASISYEEFPMSEEVQINEELFTKDFYKTDYYISSIIYQISSGEVKRYLREGYIVMFTVGMNSWTLQLEDNVVYLDYSQISDATECNYMELFTMDTLAGFIEGVWHIIDKDEEVIFDEED